MLEKEIVIEAPRASVWKAWTTEEGLSFLSRKSNIELRLGGPYEWFLDLEPDSRGRRGSQGAQVLAFLPEEMLAFTWTFPPDVPSLRFADETTQVVVLFRDEGTGTRVRFVQHGWQEGADWDQGYAYFDAAWDYVLKSMKTHLEGGPP